MSLRKIIKTRGSFPTEEAAFKLFYLALVRVVEKWDTVQHWKQMLNYLDTMLRRPDQRSRRAQVKENRSQPTSGMS